MGRPRTEVDLAHLKLMASRLCTLEEMAADLGCSTRTLSRRFGKTITRARGCGQKRLRLLQWQAAKKGSVPMLIHLGKQYLGQTDRQEITAEVTAIERPYDPIAVFTANPALRDRAMQLERDLADATAALSIYTGADRATRLAVPAPHSSARGSGNGTADHAGQEQIGGGDPG